MQQLTPDEEAAYLAELYDSSPIRQLDTLRDSFNTLQSRSQLLLSLITLCLTITGFSGPKIAQSGMVQRYGIVVGIGFILLSAIILITGPLQLRWVTCEKAQSTRETVRDLIVRRNARTRRYGWAACSLLLGLLGYVVSVMAYLFVGA